MVDGLGRVRRGGRSVVRSIYDDAGRRWPVIPLVGLWILAIYRVVRTFEMAPRTDVAIVWSIAIVAAAIVATVAWMRAGSRRTAPRSRGRPEPVTFVTGRTLAPATR